MLLPLPLLLLPLLTTGPQDDALAGGLVRSVQVERPAGTRVEHFELERGGEVVGLVRWIAGPDPEAEGGWRVEQEVRLFAERTQVVHTERLHSVRRKVVFREVREGSGRTLLLLWSPEGQATLLQTVGGEILRQDLGLGPDVLLPLALIEHARSGTDWEGRHPVFLPLSGGVEALDLETRVEGEERVLELRREDGTLAGSYRFRGEALTGFRWQRGALRARAIPTALFRERVVARALTLEAEGAAQAEEASWAPGSASRD